MCHLAESHAFPHKFSAFIYIDDDYFLFFYKIDRSDMMCVLSLNFVLLSLIIFGFH